jgi:tetratricopeptide (TPR) repeat protein
VLIFSIMLKPTYLLTIVLALFMVVACHQQTAPGKASKATPVVADSTQVEKLIAQGNNMQNASKDSLPWLAKKLDNVSHLTSNHRGIIYANIFRAYYYWFTTHYAQGMKAAINALNDADKWQVHGPIPDIYSIMANMHKENGNYTEAFKACIKGLEEAKANRDTGNVISLLGLRAMFTHGYYRKNNRANDDHTSLQLEFEALHIAESEPKYEKMRIRFYNNIAQTYKEQGEYANALLYGNKAVALIKKYHQDRSLTYSYNWLGESYYYMGQKAKGVAYLDSAIAVSRRLNLPYREMEIYEAMYWCYMSAKDYEPAIACTRRTSKMRDSLQIAKNEKQISELQLKYETVKKDAQIVSLDDLNKEKSRKITWILVGLGFSALLLIIIAYQYYVIHMNTKRMQANNDKLNDAMLKIAHIQSHQVRRPLASILGLLNVVKANDYYATREVLQKMEISAQDLDKRIRQVIKEAEVAEDEGAV